MLIQPRVRGFICTTAHPEGCKANVDQQIQFAMERKLSSLPKRVLVIGGSAGYGLSSRVVTAFAGEAATLSVSFEKEGNKKRTASAGWYNNHFFEQQAKKAGLYAESINGDAFSAEVKEQVADKIAEDLGKIDLLVYSLAAPKRFDIETEQWVGSSLKPINKAVSGQSIDASSLNLVDYSTEEASSEEIENTVFVMGGSDWSDWIEYLKQRGLLANGFNTVSFSYLGGELTRSIYMDGTIGRAKEDLEAKAEQLNLSLKSIDGSASVAVLKAIVTQSSSAIPSFSLYISLLYEVMKSKGVHEDCIEQIHRLMSTGLYGTGCEKDKSYRYRLDNLELKPEIQQEVTRRWNEVSDSNLKELADVNGYINDFHKLFGFGFDDVNYDKEVTLPVA